jgi:PAS domain S-box-containing protein
MYARLQVAYSDIREREAKLRSLVDSNIIGICIFDFDGRITEANGAFLRLVGYSAEDVNGGGMSFAGLAPAEWAGTSQQLLAQLAATGTWQPGDQELLRGDGSRVPVLVGGVRFGETRHQGIAFVVDQTERKRVESELIRANRISTMGHLSASIAHEMNQPLTGVIIGAETAVRLIAIDRPDMAAVRSALSRVVRDGKRAGEVFERIRSLIRKTPPQKTLMDVNEMILETIGLTHGEAVKTGVLVQTRLNDGLAPIWADRVQFQQVVLNLVMNAIDAMRDAEIDAREIMISTAPTEAGEIHVRVEDSGPGIEAGDMGRLFNAFYTTKATGLGMGLTICRSIVEAHGGRIWVTQNEQRGACFQFTAPVDIAPHAAHP